MKRILTLLLIMGMLILILCACSDSESEKADAFENPQTSEQEPPKEERQEEPQLEPYGTIMDSEGEDEVLISELTNCLNRVYRLLVQSTAVQPSFAEIIYNIENGTRPLYVEFDPSSYYFVCAYYDGAYAYESIDFCCINNYTWVKFNSADEISEYYNGEKFIVGFQMNKAVFIDDILSDEEPLIRMESYQFYTPEFNNRKNQNSAIDFNKSFIYLDSSDKNEIYHSASPEYCNSITMKCVNIENVNYIALYLYLDELNADGVEKYLKYEFRGYYEDLIKIADSEKYSTTNDSGYTSYFAVISFDDFAKFCRDL